MTRRPITAVVEDQDHAEPVAGRASTSRAVLVCHSDPDGHHGAEWTYWASRAEAGEAIAVMPNCGPRCRGVHTIARVDLKPSPRPSITDWFTGAKKPAHQRAREAAHSRPDRRVGATHSRAPKAAKTPRTRPDGDGMSPW